MTGELKDDVSPVGRTDIGEGHVERTKEAWWW